MLVNGSVEDEGRVVSNSNRGPSEHDPHLPPSSASRRFYEEGDWTTEDRPEVAWLTDRLTSLSTGGRDTLVLDLGCGVGSVTEQLIGRRLGIRAIGIDVSYRALTKSAGGGLRVVQAQLDGELLPIASATIDVVVLTQVIEHVADTDGLTEEIMRVLKPGGTLLLSTPNLGAWFNRMMLLGGMQPVFSEVSFERVFGRPGSVLAGHLRIFTRRALVEFLTFHGFVEMDVRGATYHDVPRGGRWIDRALKKYPTVAAQLLVAARKPSGTQRFVPGDTDTL
jgi:SAM-dependent methyltransferase